ncbi:transcriptional regulator ATRX-like isoform X2 [Penaeus chinensis]|uniref:transcriptional regulator ATRX-like isoform X2 n=1 Tax=Penaeus chinensis TaxID=139456 RepID=UPI001FB849B5|nr:transcriptional regulator ATRX-like isoform X2 [Penaeus chinensis]
MRRMKIRAVPNMRPGGSQRTGPGPNKTAASSIKLPGIVKEEAPGNDPQGSAELEANATLQSSEMNHPDSHTTADVIAQSIKLEKTSVKGAAPEELSSPSTSQTSLSNISPQRNLSQESILLDKASTQQDSLLTSQSDNPVVHVAKDTKVQTESQAEGSLGPPEDVKVKQESVQNTASAGENKALASMRRKRLKIAPMVSTGRKGAINAPSVCEPSTSKKTVGSETIDRKTERTLAVSQGAEAKSRDEQSVSSQMEKDSKNNISKTEIIDICTEEKDFSQGGTSDTAKESEISIISEGIASGTSGVVPVGSASKDKSQDPQVKRVKFAADTVMAHTSNYKPTDSEVVVINSDISPEASQSSSEERRNDDSGNSLLKSKCDSKEGVQAVECVESSTSQGSGTCIRRARIRAKPAFSVKKRPPKKVDAVEVKKEPSTKEAEEVKSQPKEPETSTAISSSVVGDGAEQEPVTERTETSVVQERVRILKRETAVATTESSEETVSNQQSKKTDSSIEESKEFVLQQSKILEKNRQELTQEERVREREDADSDDSCGDKENSSKGIKHIKKEVTSKSKSFKPSKGKLSQVGLTSPKIKLVNKIKGNEIDSKESIESTEKKIFRERKEKFRKKLTKGSLEPKSMTMFDLIFFNPAANPMPGRSDSPKKRRRLNSKCETESVTSDILEEQKVDDLGLDTSEPPEESRPSTPEVQVCEEDKEDLQKDSQEDGEEPEKNEEEEQEEQKEEEVDTLAPRVKIGANGQIILDETSLKIRTTAAKNRDEILSKAEVVEESNDTSHYGKWSKKRKRSSLWTMKETARFYKALSTVGTDFSLMETLFAWRSRAELKTKFKKEERSNRALVDKALQDSTQFDFSLFDIESDYDPEEDRKACKEAEREEAKRRRLEIKQEEKARVKEEKEKIKAHKSNLRKKRDLLKKIKKKKKDTSDEEEEDEDLEEEDIPYDDGNDPSSGDEAEMEEAPAPDGDSDKGETSKLPKKEIKPQRKRRKRAVPKKKSEQSPLVISEVTVTVETVKYNQPASSEEYVCEKTIAEDAAEGSKDPIAVGHSTFATQGTESDTEAEQKVWHFPISDIQTLEDGKQVVEVPTPAGPKIVPVPTLAPGTSNVIVMATDAPDSPGEHIYHVYLVSPLENA